MVEKIKLRFINFMSMSLYQKLRYCMKIGAYIVVIIEVLEIAIEKFKELDSKQVKDVQ